MPKGVYQRNNPHWNPWNKELTKESDERVAKLASANLGNKYALGHTVTIEARNLISIRTKGGMVNDEVRNKLRWRRELTKVDPRVAKQSISLKNYWHKLSKEEKILLGTGRTKGLVPWNKKLTKEIDERVAKNAEGISLAWSNLSPKEKEIRIRRVWLSACRKPNRVEIFLDNILQENFPNEWEYVGNGKLIINGLIPDFANINGKKQLIELFGDYWHKDDNPEDRINKFAELGYTCLVIWESELKDIEKVINRTLIFSKGGL